MGNSDRPIGVTVIGIIQIIEAIAALISGICILYLLSLTDGPGPGGLIAIVFGYPLIAIGIISFLLGVGVLENWMWIWYSEVISLILGLIVMVLFALGLGDLWYYMLTGIVADVAGLLYFFKKNVRLYFHI